MLDVYETVWVPYGDNQRYDLVIEDAGKFLKVQCKTGRLIDGAIRFNACSLSYHHPNRGKTTHYMHDYRGQADYFGIYCPETAGVYLVPVDEVGLRRGALRIASTKNGQQKNIRWARDHEVSRPAAKPVGPPSRGSAPIDPENALRLWPA